MTRNGVVASAVCSAARADAALRSTVAGGSATVSTRPANQAAGSIASVSTKKPRTSARQPKAPASACPIGADSSAPSDPAPVMKPRTRLRTVAGTARDATAMAIAEAVQASATPISTPAPIMTAKSPRALASSMSPAQ
jgi:hypothetical protein